MRNSFIYTDFNQDKLLKALLHLSISTDYISILVSNTSKKISDYPKDYINYDLIAGLGVTELLISNNNSFDMLNKFHALNKDWLFGYLSYDLKNEDELLSSENIDNFSSANLSFFIPEYVFLLINGKLEVRTHQSQENCDKLVKSFNFSCLKNFNTKTHLNKRTKKSAYLNNVERIKNHIQSGDIYEMNYCQEFYATNTEIVAESVFLELNKLMLTPFSSFIKLKHKYVISSSPERFLRKKSGNILSQPIKGTRRRGDSNKEDIDLIKELEASQKDISENLMITDLVRNDLSITAKKESVKVDELCKVYSFNKIHQMITTISSEIDIDMNFTDVLKKTFPMGSMTGAPKIRAMELIEYFEDFKRGIFSGAIGYITPEEDFDFNVVIRTILYNLENHYLSIGVGGAITIKSDPNEEYEECLIKVKPLFDVLNFTIDD